MIDISLFSNLNFDKYRWKKTPSLSNPPEFVDAFQVKISIIDSSVFVNDKPTSFFKNLILENQKFIEKSNAIYLLDVCRKFLNNFNYLGKVSFWKILKNGEVKEHKDVFSYHKLVDRYILNINMNHDKCKFVVDGKKIISNPGDIIYFDHSLIHSITNRQDEDVYFLAFDTFKAGVI